MSDDDARSGPRFHFDPRRRAMPDMEAVARHALLVIERECPDQIERIYREAGADGAEATRRAIMLVGTKIIAEMDAIRREYAVDPVIHPQLRDPIVDYVRIQMEREWASQAMANVPAHLLPSCAANYHAIVASGDEILKTVLELVQILAVNNVILDAQDGHDVRAVLQAIVVEIPESRAVREIQGLLPA